VLIGMNVVLCPGAYPFGKLAEPHESRQLLVWGLLALIRLTHFWPGATTGPGLAAFAVGPAFGHDSGTAATMWLTTARRICGARRWFLHLVSGLPWLLAACWRVLWDSMAVPDFGRRCRVSTVALLLLCGGTEPGFAVDTETADGATKQRAVDFCQSRAAPQLGQTLGHVLPVVSVTVWIQ